MANLLHQNKKMTAFEVLETIEALRFEEGFVDRESVSAANVIIFPSEDEGMDTDENDGNDVNCIPDNLFGRQLLSAVQLDLLGTGGTNLIIDESQASGSSQVTFSFILTFSLVSLLIPECSLLFEKEICSRF